MRLLPDQIRVAVVERQPVAFVRHAQQIGLVDANGVLLDMPASMMAQHHYSFPVVTGIDSNDPSTGPQDLAHGGSPRELLGERSTPMGSDFPSRFPGKSATADPEDARVLMPEPGSDILAHFGEEADGSWSAISAIKRILPSGGNNIPSWPKWICATTSKWCWRWRPGVNAMQPAQARARSRESGCDPKCTVNAKPSAGQPASAMASGKTTAPAKADAPAKTASNGKAGKDATGKAVRASAKPPGKQSPAMRAAAIREKKKRAEAKRAALNVSKQKPSPKPARDTSGGPGSVIPPRRATSGTMSHKSDNLIVVLDIGSAWTRVLAADLNEGALRYRGHGVVESAGMRKGLIAELNPAAKAVKAACTIAPNTWPAATSMCAWWAWAVHYVRGLNTNSGFELSTRMREITREDVREAVERARAVERPPDREILHLLPRQFILDDQPGVFDPVGMVGARLEVDLHIATCSGSALQSTVTCANRAGLEVTEAVLESIASAEATLSADERELGVCLLDIGCHSSDLVVFFEGAVAHTASVPIGGQHPPNDLAASLHISVAQSWEFERRRYGHAVVTSVPQLAEIEILNPQPQMIRLRQAAEYLQPRAERADAPCAREPAPGRRA